MEKRALALREMIKKENRDPRRWIKQGHVRGFADFMQSQQSDKEDNSFDDKEMCEYGRREEETEAE